MKAKSPNGYRIGIVNPLTLVGNELQTILRERGFPFAKITLLDSSGVAVGALTEVVGEAAYVAPVSDDELEDLDLVFFCGPAEPNSEWIAKATEDDFVAIDLSQPSTVEDGILVVSGLPLDALSESTRQLVSPHPIATPLALILDRLQSVAAIELVTASVIQPASEFEQGVEELAQQTVQVLNIQPITKSVFDRQLAFNLYPAQEHLEEFIVGQVRRLVSQKLPLALQVTQGTLFHSHVFQLFVKFSDAVDTGRIVAALNAGDVFAFAEGDQEFGSIDAAGKDEILILEVRADATVPDAVWVWATCDNVRRGAALNAILIAEALLSPHSTN